MSLVIKCAGEHRHLTQNGRGAVYGFTVRMNHRVVLREAGWGPPGSEDVRLTAICRALKWLHTCSASPARPVEVRTDATLPGGGPVWEQVCELLEALRLAGRRVHLTQVHPEWVSEAGALCRHTLLEEAKRAERASGITIVCDGSFRPDPVVVGSASYGWVAWGASRLLHRESGVVCRGVAASSVVAELGAVVAALRWLAGAPVEPGAQVEIRSDCRQVLEALSSSGPSPLGRGTAMLRRTALRLLGQAQRQGCQVRFWHAHRVLVAEADLLARKVHDQVRRGGTLPIGTFLGRQLGRK